MPAAAIPVASTFLAPALADAAGTALAGTALGSLASSAPWLLPAISGAGIGGIGSLLTGQNPLKGALLGGVGAGVSKALLPNGIGGLFNSSDAATEAVSPDLAGDMAKADSAITGKVADSSQYTSPGKGIGDVFGASGIGKVLPYAGLAAGSLLLNNATTPKQIGPGSPSSPSNPGPVSPLNRQVQTVDPRSYFTSGGNRSFYAPYSMQPQFMAKGGRAKYANGGSSSASSSNVPVRGRGDGRSDSIPAMLSDGEFVISAPAVSALGNGSNDAGARKLATAQKNILRKHYGGNPKKAAGLGSYMQ